MFYVLNCLLSNGCSIPESPCVGSSLPHVVLQHCILHVVSGFPGRVSSLLLAVLILGLAMPSQEQPRNRKSSRCRIRAVAIDALVKSKSRQKRQRKEPLPPPPLKEANQESRSSAAPSWAACEAVQPETLARRLACGHTKEARLLLAQTRLFHFDGADDLPEKSGLQQPCRGLQADYLGDRVYILDTYNCRGKLQADVAPIRPGRQPGKFVLGTNKTASGSDLANLGNDFILSIGARGRPELRRCSPDAEPRSTGVGPAAAASLGMPRSAGAQLAVPEHGKPDRKSVV